jgi:hypothetical protein
MYKNALKRSITTVLIGIEQRIRTKLLGMAAHNNASRAINAHGFGVLLQMKREANVSSSIIHTPGTKDATPESGLVPPSAQVGTPRSVCPPGQNCPPITSDVDDATIMTASTTQELVTMQLEMANLVQSLNRFHIP